MSIECNACGITNEAAVGSKCFVCGSVLATGFDREESDRLTKRYTAMDTFAALVAAMGTPERQLYCPSIYPNNAYKGKKVPGKVRLAEIIRSQGFKVYDGSRVA